MAAARPLDRNQRDAFLQAVAAELRKAGGSVGPGTVHRICAELQRRFILAPDLDLSRQSKRRDTKLSVIA